MTEIKQSEKFNSETILNNFEHNEIFTIDEEEAAVPLKQDDAGATIDLTNSSSSSNISQKVLNKQILICFAASMPLFMSGMATVLPAITIKSMTNPEDPMRLSEEEFSWFASINNIFCLVGALMASYTVDRFGRKLTIIFILMLVTSSWGIAAVASTTNKNLLFMELIISRIFNGLSNGVSVAPTSIYLNEITHPSLRVKMLALPSFMSSFSMLCTFFLGYLFPTNWRIIVNISLIASVAVFPLVLYYIPETPVWLVTRNRFAQAESSIRTLNAQEISESQLKLQMNALIAKATDSKKLAAKESAFDLLTIPEFVKPLGILLMLVIFQQLSGTFVVTVYAVKFCQDIGIKVDPFVCAIYIAVVRLIGSTMVGFVMGKYGRRFPTMFSGFSMTISLGAIIMCIIYSKPSWVSVALMLWYIFASTMGVRTLPFIMISELFALRFRGVASGIVVCAIYVFTFAVLKMYPMMVNTMGTTNVLLFYCIFSILSIAFVYYFVPDTRGKTLDQIEDIFKKKNVKEEK